MHLAAPGDRAAPGDHVNLVLLHEKVDAVGALLHHRVFVLQCAGHLKMHFADIHAELFAFLDFLQQVGAVQQRLGGDAADIEADAAHRAGFDNRGLHAQLRRAHRCDIPTRPRPDDHQIVDLLTHKRSFLLHQTAP
jgi:hypothetical protein